MNTNKATFKFFLLCGLMICNATYATTWEELKAAPSNYGTVDLPEDRRIFEGTRNFRTCEQAAQLIWYDQVTTDEKESEKRWNPYWKQQYVETFQNLEFEENNEEKNAEIFITFLSQKLYPITIDSDKYIINDSFKCNNNTFSPEITSTQGNQQDLNCGSAQIVVDTMNNPQITPDKKKKLLKHIESLTENAYYEESEFSARLTKMTDAISDAIEGADRTLFTLMNCEAYTATTEAYTEYKNDEYEGPQTKTSFDGKIECKSEGIETQDYPACKKMVNAYDGVFAGRIAIDAVQQIDYQSHTMDTQMTLQKDMQDDPTAGLKAQQSSVSKQAGMMNQKAAAEAAGLAVLWKYYNEMPGPEDLKAKCEAIAQTNNYPTLMNSYKIFIQRLAQKIKPLFDNHLIGFPGIQVSGSPTEGMPAKIMITTNNPQVIVAGMGVGFSVPQTDMGDGNQEIANHCTEFLMNGTHALLQNQEAKDKIKGAMIMAGVDIAKYLAQAALLKKQAGKIGDAIDKVEAFTPEDMAYDDQDVLTTECQINPSAPACRTPGLASARGFYDGGITISGFQGGGQTTATASTDDKTSDDSSAVGTTAGGPTVPGLGGIDNPVAKASGLDRNNLPGAASSKSTAGGGGGGGGGGSVPNGSAPSGGGGSVAGGGGGQAAIPSGGKKIAYSGSSSGSLSYGGGSSRKKITKKKSANPFGSLLGKKRSKGGVLNYRGIASKGIGSKKGSLFNMISTRYSNVNKEKRLMQYKLK
jgi:hypothetical protein